MRSLPPCLTHNRYSSYRLWNRCSNSRNNVRHQSSIPLQTVESTSHNLPSRASRSKNDPWIRPESLQDTLDEHRRANRSGKAVDGVPVRTRRAAKDHVRGRQGSVKSVSGNYRRLDAPPVSSSNGGEVPALSNEWRENEDLTSRLALPWLHHLDATADAHVSVSAQGRLEQEVAAFGAYMISTPAENVAASMVFDAVKEVISEATKTLSEYSRVSAYLIGSRTTGLYGPLSDLDINLCTVESALPHRTDILQLLRTIFKHVRYVKPREEMTLTASSIRARSLLKHATVPIIECNHPLSGLEIQIQCTQSSFESAELTKAYASEFPTLRPLLSVIKHMLHIRGLGDAWTNGLGSYTLLNMIVVSLKLGNVQNSDVGSQLLQFLDFFSKIDFDTTSIKHYPSTYSHHTSDSTVKSANHTDLRFDPITAYPFLISRSIKPADQVRMSLQDPVDPDNDLGQNTSNIKNVQATFIQAHYWIRQEMETWDRKRKMGLDPRLQRTSLLSWCLRGDYTIFEEKRRRLQRLPEWNSAS